MNSRFRDRRFWLLSVPLLMIVLVFATSLLSAEKGGINYKSVRNLQEIADRSPAPPFTLPNLEGGKVSLKDFRGKLVMLNFWATWCVPCREEMPAMERLYAKFKQEGFLILGVNLKDDKQSARSFVKELKISFPIAFDPEGEVGLLYGAWGLPATYLIDADGIALARAWGPADWFSPGARDLIKKLLDRRK